MTTTKTMTTTTVHCIHRLYGDDFRACGCPDCWAASAREATAPSVQAPSISCDDIALVIKPARARKR